MGNIKIFQYTKHFVRKLQYINNKNINKTYHFRFNDTKGYVLILSAPLNVDQTEKYDKKIY